MLRGDSLRTRAKRFRWSFTALVWVGAILRCNQAWSQTAPATEPGAPAAEVGAPSAASTTYRFNLFSNFTLFLNDPENGDESEQVDRRTFYGGKSAVASFATWPVCGWIRRSEPTGVATTSMNSFGTLPIVPSLRRFATTSCTSLSWVHS